MKSRATVVRRILALVAASALPVAGLIGVQEAQADKASPATSRCSRALDPGTQTIQVSFRGTDYPVRVHVPVGAADHRDLPMVMNLHPSSGNAETHSAYSDLDAVADEENFIVVAPNGDIPAADPNTDGIWFWNVPDVPTTAGELPPDDARDDVAFLTKVIDRVDHLGCVDDDRVFMTGFSGGARMTSAYACERPDKVAAIAPVAGLRFGRPSPDDPMVPELQSCDAEDPVPVVTFHGDGDTVNPYEGNGDPRWGYTVPFAAQLWARSNDCRVGPEVAPLTENVTTSHYRRCEDRADVLVYRITGGTHSWPGADDPNANQEISASELAWQFFEDHPRR